MSNSNRRFPLATSSEVRNCCTITSFGMVALKDDPILWHPNELREAGIQFVDLLISEMKPNFQVGLNYSREKNVFDVLDRAKAIIVGDQIHEASFAADAVICHSIVDTYRRLNIQSVTLMAGQDISWGQQSCPHLHGICFV